MKREFRITMFRPGYTPAPGICLIDGPLDPSKPLHWHDIANAVEPMLGDRRMGHVAALMRGEWCDMFIDDGGLQRGELPNEHATDAFRRAIIRNNQGLLPEQLGRIYGPAVLFDGVIL